MSGPPQYAAPPIRTAHLLARVPTRRRGYRNHRTFTDPAVTRDLARHGYHVTDQILDAEQVAAILDVCTRWEALQPPASDSRFRTSYAPVHTPSALAARAELLDLLVPGLRPLVHADTTRISPAAIQYKPAGPDSGLRSHQDASLVDERSAVGIVAWVALTDMTAADGALLVLPGSHRYGAWARVSTTTDDFEHLRPAIERHSRVLPVRAGQVILFDNALIHGSLVNRGAGPRIAVSAIITPEGMRVTIPVAVGDGVPTHATLRGSDPHRSLDEPSPPVSEWEDLGTIALRPLTFGVRGLDAACRLHARLCPGAPGDPMGPDDATG